MGVARRKRLKVCKVCVPLSLLLARCQVFEVKSETGREAGEKGE